MAADMSWFFAASAAPVAQTNNIFNAASRGEVMSLTEALDKGEDDVPCNGWRAVHCAAAKGHLKCFQLLHERRYNGDSTYTGVLSPLTSSGENVLHLAAGRGKINVCEYILNVTAKEALLIRNSEDYTSLHLAAHNGHKEVVKLLVNFGCDAGVTTSEGVTPLLLAAGSGKINTFLYLISLDEGQHMKAISNAGLSSLHKASSGGHINLVSECIKHKIPIDSEAENGATSLHLACQNGYLNIVLQLIEAGADVLKKNLVGQTSLHKAAFEGHLKVVDCLLKHHADPSAVDNSGYTVLMCAAAGGRHGIIDRLCNDVSLKIDVEKQLSNGEDAAILAANNGYHEVASKLTRLIFLSARKKNLIA